MAKAKTKAKAPKTTAAPKPPPITPPAPAPKPPKPQYDGGTTTISSKYVVKNYSSYKIDDDDQLVPLANFTAEIVQETRTIDGIKTDTVLTISGQQGTLDPETNEYKAVKLPDVKIDAGEFAAFAWVLRAWGSRAVIYPGGSSKDDLRAAIQLGSKPKIQEIFGTMGWQQQENGDKMYLHAGGAIKEKGNDKNVNVSLPPELARFNLADQEQECELADAFQASQDLIKLGPPEVMIPIWAATYAPILGPCDFAVHLTGRSGTFKSEITSLFQSHYGGNMDARHLPASWSSTQNALEAQAHFAANAVMVIDDFVPNGSSYQVKQLQSSADRLIRGQGNQAGRARLSDAASFKSAYYPRGLILSTGEDTPEGHSVRARMLILELSPGDINVKQLTQSQADRKKLPAAMQGFIQDAADTVAPDVNKNGLTMIPELQQRINDLRDLMIEIGHSRTPPMLARLIATAETVYDWAAERGLITPEEKATLTDDAIVAITNAGMKQQSYLESADPVTVLMNALRASLMAQKCHIRSMSGGVPTQPEKLGWITQSMTGEQPKYKAGGITIGWIDWDDDTIYLEADLAFGAAKKEAGQDLAITKGTAHKRLKDAGMLTRTDGARQRNTVRVTADGSTRNVLAMKASDFFDTQEVNEDGSEQLSEDDASGTGAG